MSLPENLRERKVTRYGRVVYNRKKHEFKIKDAVRIGNKLAPEFVVACLPEEAYRLAMEAIYTAVVEAVPPEPDPWSWFPQPIPMPDLSYGGGGASRIFGGTQLDYLESQAFLIYQCQITEE